MVPRTLSVTHRGRRALSLWPAIRYDAMNPRPRAGLEQSELLERRNHGLELCREANRSQALLLV